MPVAKRREFNPRAPCVGRKELDLTSTPLTAIHLMWYVCTHPACAQVTICTICCFTAAPMPHCGAAATTKPMYPIHQHQALWISAAPATHQCQQIEAATLKALVTV